MSKTIERIEEMRTILETKLVEYYDSRFPRLDYTKVTLSYGRKYAKLIVNSSVHSFVNIESGDIYKAASYRAPAKHIRGNVWEKDCSFMKGWGLYGAAYL